MTAIRPTPQTESGPPAETVSGVRLPRSWWAAGRSGLLRHLSSRLPFIRTWRHKLAQELRQRGVDAARAGDPERALQHYRGAIEIVPDDPDIWCDLGQTLYEADRLEEAEQSFRSALQYDHGHQAALKGLGFALQTQGQDAEAVYFYLRYLEHDDQDAGVLLNVGAALHNSGDYHRALRYYGKAYKLDRGDPRIAANRGRALFALGKLDQAIPSLRRALKLDPDNSEVRGLLGSVLQASGKTEDALREFEAAIVLDPNNTDARLNAAFLLEMLGEIEPAIAHAEHALQSLQQAADSANLPAAYHALGWYYYRSNRLDRSIAMSRRAIEVEPSNFGARFNLALALLVQGDIQEAQREYRAGLGFVSLASDLKVHGINDLEDALRRKPDLPGGKQILRELLGRYAEMKRRVVELSDLPADLKSKYDALTDPAEVTSNLPPGTFMLTLSSPHAHDFVELQGGVLTHFLLEGLSGEAADSGGLVTAEGLGRYVHRQVRRHAELSGRLLLPVFSSNWSSRGDLVLRGPSDAYSDLAGLIVGVSRYEEAMTFSPLPYANADGARVFDALKALSFAAPNLRLLVDEEATGAAISRAVEDTTSQSSPETLLVFYYSGHTLLGPSGEVGLAAFDSKLQHGESLVQLESLKAAMERSASEAHVLLLEATAVDHR